MDTRKIINLQGGSLGLRRGTQLGKYRLVRPLGTGGTCEVWEARDRVEDIRVALKIPLAGAGGQRDSKALLREVRAVSRLRHSNLLSVKNADIIEGHVVLATELSTGTLEDRSRPMSARRVVPIIAQVLEGLACAHRHRIAHCDVTPGNIFLFSDKRAALGDFGISIRFKGRMRTIDDYGTPGYVAPEQAFGRPTYRSDCFSVGLILYEYITGFLPRWPFGWPFRRFKQLREKTSPAFVGFIRQSLAVDPDIRFANAGKMLTAMMAALPGSWQLGLKGPAHKTQDWHKVRREAFVSRYGKVFPVIFRCVECDEPIAERMQNCPWCGTDKNQFDDRSQFSHICPRCHKGVRPEWNYCPWCYGAGFEVSGLEQVGTVRYHTRCEHCQGRLMRFMRYCPWCRRKVRDPWLVWPFPEVCGRCGWSVDSDFWHHCPWCKARLKT